MKIDGDSGFIEITCCEFSTGEHGVPDLLLNVNVSASGFAAADQAWVGRDEWLAFIGGLRHLEHERCGRAHLDGLSPDEFVLELFSTDRAGHMALVGKIRRPHVDGFTFVLEFGFRFEPDRLPTIVQELAQFTDDG